jgi:hypothetical protein
MSLTWVAMMGSVTSAGSSGLGASSKVAEISCSSMVGTSSPSSTDGSTVTVAPPHVFKFLAHQRGDRTVVRLSDRESGLSARMIAAGCRRCRGSTPNSSLAATLVR